MPDFKVMIVEDEVTIASLLQVSLSDLGNQLEVRLAHSGAIAIDQHQLQPVNLLITDYYLEDTNALDLVTELREIDDKFIWILITAFGSDEMEENARAMGVYAIYHKPFPVTDLKRAVMQILHANQPG
ncbi:MAG: response regulator [Anaerolineae bacterium]|jgi:DNA-binding NtrC family response regulator|nr:response regulator [Anaerolineae bacterium]